MKLRETFAGAPIYRGRWAAIIWLWWSGVFIGEMDIGIFWELVGTIERSSDYFVTRHLWAFDAGMLACSVFCLVMGVLSIDRYGRNAWFTWAPDDVHWGDLCRDDVTRLGRWRGSRLTHSSR